MSRETKKESPKKTVTPTKEKAVKKESPRKETPKASKAEELVPDEVPPSLEKKKSSYRSFMARDGPRALGSKPIPEVSVNSTALSTTVVEPLLTCIWLIRMPEL